MSLEQNRAIARACHEALRAYSDATGFMGEWPTWMALSLKEQEAMRGAVMRHRDGDTIMSMFGWQLSAPQLEIVAGVIAAMRRGFDATYAGKP